MYDCSKVKLVSVSPLHLVLTQQRETCAKLHKTKAITKFKRQGNVKSKHAENILAYFYDVYIHKVTK